ncbi:MAG TPA: hypothetical protein DEQ28_09325 [Clostridiales bacterium]|nr:hypothetical protein [Clostridiales bacterium]
MRGLALVLMLVSLVAAVPVLAGRIAVEQPNRQVELVLDREEAAILARTLGVDLPDLLPELAAAGITSLAVTEATPLSLAEAGRLAIIPGGELRLAAQIGRWDHPWLWPLLEAGAIRDGHTYLLLPVGATADWLAAGLARRPGSVERHSAAGWELIGIAGGRERVEDLRLGIYASDLRLARQAGLTLVPRFSNYRGITAAEVAAAFREVRAAGRVTTVIFAGTEVLGYPAALEATADNLRGLALGLVETPVQRAFIRQDGHERLAAMVDYQVVRVYSISRREIDRHLNPSRAIEMWVRAVKERNIRVLYLRPFLNHPLGYGQVDLRQLNLNYIADLVRELRLAGFEPGPAQPFADHRVAGWVAALAGLGVVGAGLMLLGEFLRPGPRWAWALALAGITAVGGLFAASPQLATTVLGLGASLVFPSLAMVTLMRRWAVRTARPAGHPEAIRAALGDLFHASWMSLAGGLLVGAIMGDVRYLLELAFFRGVQISGIIPPLAAAVGYYLHAPGTGATRPGPLGRIEAAVKASLGTRLTALHVVLMVMGTGALLLYLGRMGHEAGIPVAEWEIQLRSWLERTMYARPRLKEFLIGHPALMLGGCAALLRHRFALLPAAVLAAIGQASIVNSFQHLRTPLLHSFLRTANGLALGAMIGIVLIVLLGAALRRGERGRRGGRSHP